MNRPTRKGLNRPISRREFLRLSGTALGAALLASCGGGAAPTAAPEAGGPPAFKGTLDIWDWEFPVREELVKKYIESWNQENSDIKINYLVYPWADMETKILAASSAKNGPPISDVMYFWRYDLQRGGAIEPYPDDFVDWNDRVSTPFMKDENGKIRGFPSGWFVDMIYYNNEIFEQEGLKGSDIPTKWDDFIKLAQQLTVKDSNGKISRAGCAMNDYWQHEYLWQGLIYQQSGWMYNEDGTKALWEEEPSMVALQFIQDWYNKHGIDSLELPAGYGGFCNDMAAMFMGSGWNTGFFLPEFPQMEGRFDTAVLPTFTGKPEPSYGLASPEENWQAFSNYPDDQKAAAFAFIQHMMASDERSVEWALAQECSPDSKKVLSDERITTIPTIRSQAETMKYRVCFGERPIEAEKLWRTMFDQVILEQRAVKDALHDATVEMDKVLPTKKRYFTERNYTPGA